MTVDVNWLESVGLDINTGTTYTGGGDKYLSAVYRFYNNYNKNKINIENYLDSEDYENYMVKVHSLKSNALMIGAMDLNKQFESLELAARDGDEDYVKCNTKPTLDTYSELVEKLKPIESFGTETAADEITGEEAKEIVPKLIEALDDFDDELSKELAVELSGYPFRPTQKEKLGEAIALIEDFMYDDALEIIKEIEPGIE